MFTTGVPKKEQNRPTIDTGPGLTKQSMADECNINFIMAKYKKTGTVNFVNARQGEYMEVPNIDFQQAMNTIADANTMFADMPSHLRKKFNNDPGEFLAFIHDENNVDEIYSLGLATPPEGYIPPGEKGAEGAEAEGETPPPAGV